MVGTMAAVELTNSPPISWKANSELKSTLPALTRRRSPSHVSSHTSAICSTSLPAMFDRVP